MFERGKQWILSSDALERGVWPGSPFIIYRMFKQTLDKDKNTPTASEPSQHCYIGPLVAFQQYLPLVAHHRPTVDQILKKMWS